MLSAAPDSLRSDRGPGLGWLIGRPGEPLGARLRKAVPRLALILLVVFG